MESGSGRHQKQRKIVNISEDYGDGDLELSDSDENVDEIHIADESKRDVSYISKSDTGLDASEHLPDADKLFSTVKKSSLLDSKSSSTDIDWDKLAKSKAVSDSEVCKNTHTVPPPMSYEPQSAALKPTLGDPLTERKRHSNHTDEDLDSGSGNKISKVDEGAIT